MKKKYFLGIDGGQTKTLCIIGDEKGNIVYFGKGRALDHILSSIGPETAKSSFKESLSPFPLYPDMEFESSFLGLTGVPNKDSKEAKAYYEVAKEVINSKNIFVDNDSIIALTGAFSGKEGIIVIGGTGSISLGFDGKNYARCGGFGYLFGDEGGGFQIVLQGIKIALKFEDGCHPPTLIREKMLRDSSYPSIEALIRDYYAGKIDRHKIALYTKSIKEAEEEGDIYAREILVNAGRELAKLVDCVYKKLSFKEKMKVATLGGVFNIPLVKEEFLKSLDKNIYEIKEPEFPAIVGALIKAYQLSGISLTKSLKINLKKSFNIKVYPL
ncbi:MAG: hypothetical protein N2312_00620 [Dictyoglomaceae bacterium]|nr:hypothetical protein [Dictyoglomaceae bacterium]